MLLANRKTIFSVTSSLFDKTFRFLIELSYRK